MGDAKSRGRATQRENTGNRGDANFAWLRTANDEEDRAARREVSSITERATSCRGYSMGEMSVPLKHVEAMLEGTCLISPSKGSWPERRLSEAPGAPEIRVVKDVVFQEAV